MPDASASTSRSTPPSPLGPGRVLYLALWVAGLTVLILMALGILAAPPLLVVGLILGLCVTIAIGTTMQWSGFYARPIRHGPRHLPKVALTFDDGPDERFTAAILDLLRESGQKATFFVVAAKATQHPDLLCRIVAEGHELGNHSMQHPWHMALWPSGAIARDLDAASASIEAICGVRPRFFRPPAAVLSPQIQRGAHRAGLTLVGYSARSGDGSPAVPRAVVRRLLHFGLRPGAVLLMHDANVAGRPPASLLLLPELLQLLKQRGLSSVTLSELLSG